jgi:predicted esterase
MEPGIRNLFIYVPQNLTMMRLNIYRGIFLIWSALILFTANTVAQSMVAGTVQTIQCANDSSSRYSLYLPQQYLPGKKYELLIFLDPSARGDMPVQKYRTMADEAGVVLAGSLDSKNFDLSSAEKSIPSIIADIQQRISSDASAIWLAGFSGGSRMASVYAVMYPGITGVIGCGAGFAQDAPGADDEFYTSTKKIPYAGIVGDRDMNFEEMIGVSELLTSHKKDNLLLLFDGEHEWPPANRVGVAVQWLRQYSTASAGNGGDSLAAQLINENKRYNAAGMLFYNWLQAHEYRKIHLLTPVADSLIRVIEALRNFNRERESFETVLNEERNFMDQFSVLFQQVIYAIDIRVDNAELWKPKIAFIRELKNEKSAYKQFSGQRLYDFGWRLCAEQYSWFMESKLFKQAYCSSNILSFFDGLHISPDYMMARAAAGFSDKALCLLHLKKAIKKGGVTKERVMKDSLINALFDTNDIEKLY